MTTAAEPQAWMQRERVAVKLVGRDGNVFVIIGACMKACRRAGWPQEDVVAMQRHLTDSHSYDEVLRKVLELFDVS